MQTPESIQARKLERDIDKLADGLQELSAGLGDARADAIQHVAEDARDLQTRLKRLILLLEIGP